MFQCFLNEFQTQFSATPKIFRSDNACEYKSSQLTSILKARGIINETSCPHSPQQNGVSERKHRHLLEVTQCLLSSKNVPTSYWPEALITACYLIK